MPLVASASDAATPDGVSIPGGMPKLAEAGLGGEEAAKPGRERSDTLDLSTKQVV